MDKHSRWIAFTMLFAFSTATVQVSAQEDARRQFESGKYQAVVEQTAAEHSPAAPDLKVLAHLKLSQPGEAKQAFGRLSADEAWKAVGESAIALVDGNQDAAV